ncbi:hypothetical protein B0H19DRAFT_292330 [Mycena capillaripes]|nr:hypothetical protein B0H19DRAFT_292330 [Mycena capillaripes]
MYPPTPMTQLCSLGFNLVESDSTFVVPQTLMNSVTTKDKLFQAQVLERWNLYQSYPDIYRLWSEFVTEQVPEDPHSGIVLWYGNPASFCVRLITKPGTLAWKIVHYEADLPVYDENIEIDGDVVRRGIPFIEMPAFEDEEKDLDEDCTAELALLPLVEYDSSIHFAKKAPSRRKSIT